jgi:DNA anti-recombination protein RmuC
VKVEQFLQLVEYGAAAVVAAVSVILWVHSTFQLKKDAERELQVLDGRFGNMKEDMQRAETMFQEKIDRMNSDLQSVSSDVRSLRAEVREEMQHVRSDLHGIRIDNVGFGKDLTYIKARLEPKA